MKAKNLLVGVMSLTMAMASMPMVLGLDTTTPSTEKVFTDVTFGDAHGPAIKYLKEKGVIGGYPDGSFKPNQVVNRAEALKILLLGSGINVAEVSASEKAGFTDVEGGSWYAKFVVKAKGLNIIEGYSDGSFKPAQTVNLVENLKMLLLAKNVDLTGINVSSDPYADAFANQWYAKYVQYAKNHVLIDADNMNKIFPAQGMTRATLAEAMYRLMYSEEKGWNMYMTPSQEMSMSQQWSQSMQMTQTQQPTQTQSQSSTQTQTESQQSTQTQTQSQQSTQTQTQSQQSTQTQTQM